MFFRLLLLFTAIPLLELYLLLWIGQHLGLLTTILLVIGTGVLGAWLAKSQGLAALARLRGELGAGQLPAEALLDGALILVAGAVLLTPGLLTDLAGFALLLPAGRRVIRGLVAARLKRGLEQRSGVIVVEAERP